MQITTKSSLQELAVALDPNYQVEADVAGAVRLISAFAAKSVAAEAFLSTLPDTVAQVLAEVGMVNAAKDANADPSALANFAPDEIEYDADDDDGDASAEIADALDEIVSVTKSLHAGIETLEQRVSAVEARKGVSFGTGWDNFVPAEKSQGGDLWAGSAFDLQA